MLGAAVNAAHVRPSSEQVHEYQAKYVTQTVSLRSTPRHSTSDAKVRNLTVKGHKVDRKDRKKTVSDNVDWKRKLESGNKLPHSKEAFDSVVDDSDSGRFIERDAPE